MEFTPLMAPQSCNNQATVDDLLRKFVRQSNNGTMSSISLIDREPTGNKALFDAFKDIQSYKHELEEIKKAHESVACLQNLKENLCSDKSMNVITGDKYFLIQPETLIPEKSCSLILHPYDECSPRKELKKLPSDSTLSSSSQSNDDSKTLTSIKLKKKPLKIDPPKKILIAKPEFIEFHNCEARKTYQKKIIVQNVDTQLSRFKIERPTPESSFKIFIEDNREFIAAGMNAKLIVEYESDGLVEPEERLEIKVPNGQSIAVMITVRRDPPILQVLAQTCSTLTLVKNSSESSLSSSTEESSSNESYSGSLSTSESTSDNTLDRYGQNHASFDCKKCFVGEFVMISTLIKNNGGKGRFFIMSETDWCLLKIKDITMKNMLIVPPFAVWPAYSQLDPDEILILYTYFFPESFGLQVDELYIVSDNCSVKTIEVIGDGIVFERQSLEFDNNVKYQWFQMKNKELCAMRYMDLGVGESNTLLAATFTMTSKCDLDVNYRWEVSDIILCPSIYNITIGLGKTNFPVGKLSIEPNCGVIHANSVITFRVIADLNSIKHDRYRTTLRLIVEDLPRVAIPKRFNFQCQESLNKRRLCEHSVDINFEDIDVRFKCESIIVDQSCQTNRNEANAENTMLTASLTDVTRMMDDSEFWQSAFLYNAPDPMDDGQSTKSEQICRFIKGYGICDCCKATLISTAVLRPASPLFIGILSKFSIIICNRSMSRIKYWWSQPVGSDHSKMKIKFEPSYDSIAPNSCQAIEVKCLPLETGKISSIFIACQFDARNPLVLSIECVVESLRVTFYFPPTNIMDYYPRIEWNANEYVSKYDKKSGTIKLFSMRSREEEILNIVKLNSDHSLNKTSCDTDLSNYEEYGGDFSSVDDSDVENDKVPEKDIKIDEQSIPPDFLDSSFEYEAESFVDEGEHLRLLPYFDWYSHLVKTHFRYQPIVHEIHVKNNNTVKKRIYLQNDSPIASKFHIFVKNFWSRQSLFDERNILLDTDELQTGIELKVEPNHGEIKPYETVHFDLIVNSTTWGVYTDQITVEIDYLPPFAFWIRIINDDSPISYPAYKNSPIIIPSIQFTAFKPGYPLDQRKLLLENTSDVPLYVNWHCFLCDEDEDEKPFNVVIDMVSPFFDFADFLMTNPDILEAIEQFFRCAYDRCDSDEDSGEMHEGYEGETDGNVDFDENHKDDESLDMRCSSELIISSSGSESVINVTPIKPPENKPKDTEFQISLVPYYGKLINDLFIITPKELFLPPKSKQYICIDIKTEKLKQQGKVCCKACGFIRIPPVFKYKDNIYRRKDGYFMSPMEVDLSCDLRRPRFYIRSNESECTFEFRTKEFVQKSTDKLRMAKKIMFKNYDIKSMNLTFKIDKPFSVKKILRIGEAPTEVIRGDEVTVLPNQCVQIVIKCSISQKWIEEMKNDHEHDPHNVNSMTLSKRLKIIYKEGFCQYHELYIRVISPSLAISTKCLNFGKVSLGEQKSLRFKIQNLRKLAQTFELERNEKVDYFIIFPEKALLAGKNQMDMDRLEVKVSFVPINPGVFKETVKVISEVDGLLFYCTLEGCSCS